MEFADILLISKTDLVSEQELARLKSILQTLNTEAIQVPIEHGKVPLDKVLNTGRFRAQQSPGWLKEMRGEHVPETEEFGISSFSYEARRPFDPQKFYDFIRVAGAKLAVWQDTGLLGCFGKPYPKSSGLKTLNTLKRLKNNGWSPSVTCVKNWCSLDKGLIKTTLSSG